MKNLRFIIAAIMLLVSLPQMAEDERTCDFIVDGMCFKILPGEKKQVSFEELEKRYSQKKVIIPENVSYEGTDYVVTTIGRGAFAETYFTDTTLINVKEIVLPETIDSIADWAFQCGELYSINLPDAVRYIGEGAFNMTFALDMELHLPKSLEYVGAHAFNGSPIKGTLLLRKGVEYSHDAFVNVHRLEKVFIEDGITEIVSGLFAKCGSLKEVIIPESVETIGPYAFWACGSLKSIEIPNSVIEIGKYAFYHTGISKIVLPESLSAILPYAFGDNNNLKEIICKSTTPPLATDAFDPNPNCTVYVPKGSGQTYREADGWKDFNIVEDGTTGIEPSVLLPENSNAPLYDLLGRRIYHPVKGNVYIKNGRKILW